MTSLSSHATHQVELLEKLRSRQALIGIVGLGYVGLPLAVEFGRKRLVIGFDIKINRITELQAGYDSTL
jgi:UDP-N-acetyl-D-galactosamine dehydrogenase